MEKYSPGAGRACEAAAVKALAPKLGALAHPARLDILRHLADARSCCCRDVVDRLNLAQSTVSQHLRVLVDAGLVRFEPDRQRSRYRLDEDALKSVSASLSGLVDGCCVDR